MKKRLSILCFAFLGLVNVPSVFADKDTGIMKPDFVRSIKNQKKEEAKNDAIRAIKTEKEIEVDSVNLLKYERKIGEIFIPNPKIADIDMLSDKSLYLSGLAPGVTPLVVHDKDGKVLADYIIKVTYPLRDIKEAISKIFPDLEIELVSIDNNLILKGSVASPEMAQDVLDIVGRFVDQGKIINKMTIETATQVMLKVKIAEVTRNITKSLGINWRTLSASDGGSSGLIGMAAGNSTRSLPEFSTEVMKDVLDGPLSADMDGGKWIVAAGINNLSALIDAAASETFATILAEPNLVALSGKKATFRSGGQYGYEVTQKGSDNKTTEFKDWGTSLEFTPIVLSEDRINIEVNTEVSSIESKKDEDSAPNLATKKVNTVVELGSGQSIVLAGLLQKQNSTGTIETPFLADIPLIGALFRSSTESLDERELVIIVTPYIVKPSSRQLKVPTDMVPKMLSPLKSITKRRFHRLGKEADSAGFSLK